MTYRKVVVNKPNRWTVCGSLFLILSVFSCTPVDPQVCKVSSIQFLQHGLVFTVEDIKSFFLKKREFFQVIHGEHCVIAVGTY